MPSPLHILPQPRILPNSPSIVHADFQLIVVCKLVKWRRSKALVSPLFALFFNPSHFDPPSKQTDDSKCKSDGSRLAHGVGKQRRHDLMAPLINPSRESEKPMSGSSSSWLLCGLSLMFCNFTTYLFLSRQLQLTSFVLFLYRESTDTYMMYNQIFTVHGRRTADIRHYNHLYI